LSLALCEKCNPLPIRREEGLERPFRPRQLRRIRLV
jgi:hypothetical protein